VTNVTHTAHASGVAPARRPVRALAGSVLVLSGLVLLGWYVDAPALTSFGARLQRMVPNTALGLALLAGGLVLHDRSPRAARLAQLTAGLVTVLGVATLVEVETGGDWGIDRLLPGTGFTGVQGTMAPSTAVALAVLGLAAVLRTTGRWLAQALAVVAFLAGYVAVVGYAYGASHLHAVGGYTHMSLPTALSITLLAVATLLDAPRSGLDALLRDPGSAGRLVRSLLPFLAVGPPIVGWLCLLGQQRGWYDTHFATGMLVTVLTAVSGALLLRAARHVGQADASRAQALERLNVLNRDLEQLVSERTQALVGARARFEAAFAASPLGSALTGVDGTIEEVNRLLSELTGLTREELLGRDITTLFDDDLAEDDSQARADLVAMAAGSYALERRLARPGAPSWVQVSVALVRDESGAQALIHQLEDVTARRLAEDRAEHMALHDGLTDLPNRVLLLDRLRQALAQATRSGRGVGLLFLDLDRFKVVNDSLGHHAGDLVLVEVARRLRRTARAVDTVARLGGDEFVVLCTEIRSQADVLALATVLRQAVNKPMDVEGTLTEVDASVGIAFAHGDEDPEAVLRRADQAMYRAKDRGRARAEVFDDALRDRVTHRLDTELALRGAAERGEIEAWFQPIVDLETEQVVACEALARWRRPGRDLVMPGDFVHIAEEVGLIKDIGTAVLRQAVFGAAELDDGPAVSVNVSPRQFVRADFRAVVEEALAASGLPPERLWLELTESALADALDSAARSFQQLRERGVRVAIDDFGTGFSSFSHLRYFPVDLIKVDMTFIADLTSSPRDRAIVESMLRMAEALHVDVVGEGIETPEQRDLLRIFGCRYGQGYYYARPSPVLGALRGTVELPSPRATTAGRVQQG
jgi:diguanylate cyclase (GGDEF)-like protein/PAS domain S-box-containing protein